MVYARDRPLWTQEFCGDTQYKIPKHCHNHTTQKEVYHGYKKEYKRNQISHDN